MSTRFLFQNNQSVLFIGDSITECNRLTQAAPLGNGYVKLAIDLITARYPERKISYTNKGIGGHSVVNLFDRWHDDVIRHRPDWLSIKIGINDIQSFLFNPNPSDKSPEGFAKAYHSILSQVRKSLPRTKIIIIDPFYISLEPAQENRRGKVLEALPVYHKIVHKMVREFKTLHVPVHDAFLKYLKYRDADEICPEPVHPNVAGHLIIAHEFLKVVGW
jgi:acyl-CoA thioesterase-1